MEQWIDEVVRLARERSPELAAEHAREVAESLRAAWPGHTPAEAVAWFFALMPGGWPRADYLVH